MGDINRKNDISGVQQVDIAWVAVIRGIYFAFYVTDSDYHSNQRDVT